MRKAMILAGFFVLGLAACSSAEDIARETRVEKKPSAPSAGPEDGSIPQSISIENDQMIFDYQWSDEAHQEPLLRGYLAARRKAALDRHSEDVEQAQLDASQGDYTYRPHSLGMAWETVADLPRFLSLATQIATYSGGAHGNLGHDSLIWDRDLARSINPVEMFRSPIALENAVAARYCADLDRQRQDRRGAAVEDGVFGDCPLISELTIVLLSSDNLQFDAVQLVAAPYVAGPYAEGTYEMIVPVDPQILDAVAPDFSSAFRLAE